MWTNDGDSSREDESPKSDIACHSCRRRKIRCGRELPHCRVCKRTSQNCEYPAKMLKPGPKLGSTHRNGKRRRADRGNDDEAAISPGTNLIQDESSTVASRDTTAPSSRKGDCDDVQESITVSGSGRGRISSSKDFEPPNKIRHDSINIHDLSFILHPAHEASTSEKNTSPNSTSDGLDHGKSMIIARASYALGVTSDALEKLINIYFDNMTAINIFHEPTFEEKIQSIGSATQVHALLASVLAFSARFCTPEDHDGQEFNFNGLAGMDHGPAHFLGLASRFVDEALKECGDEAPPLCLLQALVLLAHGQLTQGVRGKAWRSLGTCVRLAYELNLHLVDSGHPREIIDAKQWCDYEEKRRVWWAIWEMDVFASTIRRCPTAVDWSQIETLLPIEDEYWFEGTPRASCFLEPDLVRRWKALQESGNQSPKAWFIVINSLMKEAQSISSPRGIPNLSPPDERRLSAKSSKDQKHATAMAEEAKEKLETLSNSVRCFAMALPPSLKYRNQYLGFDARQPGQTSSLRQLHCGLYNIHVMTQLAKLMIHHYDIFGEPARACRTAQDNHEEKSGSRSTSSSVSYGETLKMNQYFEAADEILRIVHRSSDDHIQWINNFLSSTVWLASAVQLVRKEFGPPGTNRSLVKSKFEVLNMTYKKCVSFWDIQTAMQQNLETLESQLELLRISGPTKQDQGRQTSDRRPQIQKESWTNSCSNAGSSSNVHRPSRQHEMPISNNSRRLSNFNSHPRPVFQNSSPSNNILTLPIAPHTRLQDNHAENQQQPQQPQLQHPQVTPVYLEPLSPALSALDFMHLPSQIDKDAHQQPPPSEGGLSVSPSFMNDQSANMFSGPGDQGLRINDDPLHGMAFGMHMTGWNTELPSYIDELLSGACMY